MTVSPVGTAGLPRSVEGRSAALSPTASRRVFEELQRIVNVCDTEGSETIGDLTLRDLEELRKVHSPPVVVRRALEATWLLLNPASAPTRMAPPPWPRVQRMLTDAGLISRMLTFDFNVLRAYPILTSYVATSYFGVGSETAPAPRVRRSMSVGNSDGFRRPSISRRNSIGAMASWTSDENEPLTHHRVHHASHAAAALFRWSTTIVVKALEPQAREPVTEQVEVIPEPEPEAPEPLIPQLVHTPAPALPIEVPPFKLPVLVPKDFREKKIVTTARHFETLIAFELGSIAMINKGLHTLQTIAATYCMRRRLRIQLVSSPDMLENDAVAFRRLNIVQEWLVMNGIPSSSITRCSTLRRAAKEPGVVCELLLDDDTPLRDYFMLVAQGEAPSVAASRETIDFAKWLEEDFQCCVGEVTEAVASGRSDHNLSPTDRSALGGASRRRHSM